ncbi:hypothetical protein JZ751_019856 [Albula glossodonta]|uniref:Disease resistance R13L4/SHOC-2-like LRR domain-containing protein n=1 Tax=Albula glossodonta TaxID=121402 RepID=A0A8T2NU35_9TELE|nr:hypothetical protein JZ751_019856 [Albula glossodonta]
MAVGKKKASKVKITLKMAKSSLRLTADGKRRLDLSKRGIDTFPKCILKLADVEELDLSRNRLRKIPESIERFVNLRWLDLHSNQIEQLPDAIGKLQNLRHLNLCDNRLARVPPEIGDLRDLRSLNLGMNLMESVPSAVAGLTELQELGLFDNKLTQLPAGVTDLPNLSKVNTKRNPVTRRDGTDPARLAERLYLLNENGMCATCLKKCQEEREKLYPRGSADRPIRRPYFSGLSTPNSVAWETQVVWRMKTPGQSKQR